MNDAEEIHREKEQAYMQGYEDASKKYRQGSCDKCVYSTKDGYCQYDDITETIPPFEPCEDAISRQAVLDAIEDDNRNGHYSCFASNNDAQCFKDVIRSLPSVNPQEPKTGHWIEKDGFDGDTYYDCSICGESWATIDGDPWNNGMKYCPNCGAKMAESETSE